MPRLSAWAGDLEILGAWGDVIYCVILPYLGMFVTFRLFAEFGSKLDIRWVCSLQVRSCEKMLNYYKYIQVPNMKSLFVRWIPYIHYGWILFIFGFHFGSKNENMFRFIYKTLERLLFIRNFWVLQVVLQRFFFLKKMAWCVKIKKQRITFHRLAQYRTGLLF